MAKNFYDILGVKRDASQKEIKSAYRRLARKLHPDVNPGDKAAEERFKDVNRAYEVLADPEKRAKYDRYGDQWEHAEAFEKARASGFGAPGGGFRTFQFDVGDLGDILGGRGGGFENIFENIFGGARPRGPTRGQNVEYATEITLEEAYAGTTRVVQLQGEEPCGTCGGTGRIAGALCHVCEGRGVTVRPRRLEVKIPAGTHEGARVRLAGEGAPGHGGPRGDLYVVVHVRPHPRFERRGDDLATGVDVPLVDAVLGGEVMVPTIAGKRPDGRPSGRIALKVPPLTQNGRTFRLAGLGMPKAKAGGRAAGDLLVTVRVTVPEKLTDAERRLFEQLREEGREGDGATA